MTSVQSSAHSVGQRLPALNEVANLMRPLWVHLGNALQDTNFIRNKVKVGRRKDALFSHLLAAVVGLLRIHNSLVYVHILLDQPSLYLARPAKTLCSQIFELWGANQKRLVQLSQSGSYLKRLWRQLLKLFRQVSQAFHDQGHFRPRGSSRWCAVRGQIYVLGQNRLPLLQNLNRFVSRHEATMPWLQAPDHHQPLSGGAQP